MKKFCYLVFVIIIGLGTTALTSCGIKLNGPEDVLNVQTKKTVVPEKVSPIPDAKNNRHKNNLLLMPIVDVCIG